MKTLRADLARIAELIPAGASVLDVGCGTGELLHWLQQNRSINGRGLERDIFAVRVCVSQGLAVVQGHAKQDLPYYRDKAFDIVVLSRTLQVMDDPIDILDNLVRIGRHVIVSIPNFGHWKNRLYLMCRGRMPVTSSLSFQWYDTPNIHFCTLKDFTVLCRQKQIRILQKRYVFPSGSDMSPKMAPLLMPNLFAEQGIFLIGQDQS